MPMNRKDFDLLARMVRSLNLPPPVKAYVAQQLALTLHGKYTGFEPQKFVQQCGTADDVIDV